VCTLNDEVVLLARERQVAGLGAGEITEKEEGE
jgi:hypothetical protein